jgi:hypothetical protein
VKHSEVVKLKRMLLETDDDKLLRILHMLESHSDALVFSQVVEAVRPRLSQLRPARRCTVERVLVAPFEDLLAVGGQGAGAKATISRTALGALLEAMKRGLSADKIEAARKDCAAASMDDVEQIIAVGAPIWPDAAKSLANPAAFLTDNADRHGLAPQFALAADVLTLAPEILRLVSDLPPKPFDDLAAYHGELIIAALQAAAARLGGRGVIAVVLVLVARAARIDGVMELLAVSKTATTPEEKQALSGRVADFCVERAERIAKAGCERPGDSLGTTTDALTDLVNLVETIGAAGDGVRRAGIDRAVADMTRSVGAACARSLREGALADSLKALQSSATAGVESAKVEAEARELAKLRLVGRRLGLGEVVHNAARAHVDGIFSALGKRAQQFQRNKEDVSAYNRQVVNQARLVEILSGSEAAIQLVSRFRL